MNPPTRDMLPEDVPLIINSWVRTQRQQYPFSVMDSLAIGKYSKRVEALLSVSKTIVACDEQMPDLIYGFICYESGLYLGLRDTPTLHYIWVRSQFRNLGIATHLFGQTEIHGKEIFFTHISKDLKHVKHKWNLKRYDPFLVEGAIYEGARVLDSKNILWSKAIPQTKASRHSLQRAGDPPAGAND